ncbi:MAG: hypothetical protein ACLPJH_13730 [Myxococcaceae bacterium]
MALVVFLKGINVGGHKLVRPSLIAQQLKRYDVVNLGAAGTFVVRRPVSQSRLLAEVERRLPVQAEIIICDSGALLDAASISRFGRAAIRSDVVRFVSVLSRLPRRPPPTPFALPLRGRWLVRVLAREGRFLFGVYRRQMRTIGQLGAMERLFGTPITTRNWNTIAAIREVLEDGPA